MYRSCGFRRRIDGDSELSYLAGNWLSTTSIGILGREIAIALSGVTNTGQWALMSMIIMSSYPTTAIPHTRSPTPIRGSDNTQLFDLLYTTSYAAPPWQ
jgi:hypothetical protein